MTKRFDGALFALVVLIAGFALGCGRSPLGDLNYYGEPDGSVDGSPDGAPDGGPDGRPPPGCKSNADCASTPSTPYCEIPPGKCVACETSNQCPPGDACEDSKCVPLCGAGGACNGGLSCCAPVCVNETSDPDNCGGCGRRCPAGNGCVDSQCETPQSCNGGPACTPDEACCASGCSDTNSDPLNCGHCGGLCPPGDTCVGGSCLAPMECDGAPACVAGKQCCPSGCKDTSSDPSNCGACGHACNPGSTCVESKCQTGPSCDGEPACTGSETCCSTGCIDTTVDPQNCGGCGKPCAAGDSCVASMCQSHVGCNMGPACTGSDTCCTAGCTDTSSDPMNCGMCGKACGPDETCGGGFCRSPFGCNEGPMCTSPEQCCATGCIDTTSDPNNCGHCGFPCLLGESCVDSICQAETTCGTGPACVLGQTCCPSGCTDTNTDPDNCGGCLAPCAAPATCQGGACVDSEGGLNPFVNPTYLAPGVHSYTTIDIPAGVTVYVAGGGPASGTLQLNATGNITIDGIIDVSGGPGTQNTITSESTESGSAGSGGYAGEPYQSASPSAACGYVSGNPGLLGFAAEGTAGGCMIYTGCESGFNGPEVFTAILATYGGGAGIFTGYRAYGSGGGGPAGGAPGMLGAAYPGEQDCAGVAGGGGAVSGQGGLGGGAPYDGSAGVSGQTQCPGVMTGVPPAYVGGGGGGSIGSLASGDLAVAATFQTGSGGGGGSADYLNRPEFGGSSGGGGGGGALMLSTPATITINGQIFANGGRGGDAFIGTGMDTDCNPQPGAGGGGGSGGVIYLSAPVITVGPSATISAIGGTGGAQSEFATGGGGGQGGSGRIRISVTPATCTVSGSLSPSLAAGCTPTSKSGSAYVGVYPN